MISSNKGGSKMNDQTKQAARLIFDFVGVIGSLYAFWKKHEEEIKEIVNPLMKSCIEASNSISKTGGQIE